MLKVGVADYGIFVWEGGFYNFLEHLENIKNMGYDGVERLRPQNAQEAILQAAHAKKIGAGFAMCQMASVEETIRYTAALGGQYVWIQVKGGDFDDYCRQVNCMTKAANKYGLRVVLHNHLGTMVETQAELEEFLARCPQTDLLLDTGHLAVAGGDVEYIANTYFDRICAYHLKGWKKSETPDAEKWQERGHFCGLKQGDVFIDNHAVTKLILKNHFDGWVFVEHDTHLREPRLDLEESRAVLQEWGL